MSTPPVTVFVHVYYPDIWQEISGALASRLGSPFHLVVTSPHPEHDIAFPATPQLLSARFLRVENRGRDIRPFLQALAATPDVEIGLKLHTKKSPQRQDGREWRSEVLASLLPSPDGVREILGRLHADPRIGFVAPARFCLSVRPWILVNAAAMRSVMARIDCPLDDADIDHAYFAAGSSSGSAVRPWRRSRIPGSSRASRPKRGSSTPPPPMRWSACSRSRPAARATSRWPSRRCWRRAATCRSPGFSRSPRTMRTCRPPISRRPMWKPCRRAPP